MGFFSFINGFVPYQTFADAGLEQLSCIDNISYWPGTAIFWHQQIYNLLHGFRDPYVQNICPSNSFYESLRSDTFFQLAVNVTNDIIEKTGEQNLDTIRELQTFWGEEIPQTACRPITCKIPLWGDYEEKVSGIIYIQSIYMSYNIYISD